VIFNEVFIWQICSVPALKWLGHSYRYDSELTSVFKELVAFFWP